MAADRLVRFLADDGVDGAGRRFEDVLAFGDEELEQRHDFIQWLFPLDEPSRAVPGSPVLDAETTEVLRGSPVATDRMRRAASRMLDFYAATQSWRRTFDHNHLRITRIIRSLRAVCGDAEADRFKTEIFHLAGDAPIDPTGKRFWEEA